MNTRKILLTLSLVVVLAAGGLVVASNMGFKFVKNYALTGTDYWTSFPFNNNFTNAQDVCTDIGSNASLIGRFVPGAGGGRQDWTCPFGNNFSITDGEGYFIRVSSAGTHTIVGSHNPSLAIPVGGFANSGSDYILSIPYHTTATVAQDICNEVGPNASLVSRFVPGAGGGRQDWTCPFGNNFAVNIGEALAVRVSSAPTAAFTPSHY